jgi:DNA-binding MarR family transcriptional regulator
MNAIFFASKRAYHGVLRVTRRPLQVLGLTAARYDMMYALMPQDSLGPQYVPQSELRRWLGVSAPTVSRMLASLETLGWITRRPDLVDRRQREVSLTEAGLACIRAAYQAIARASMRLLYMTLSFGELIEDAVEGGQIAGRLARRWSAKAAFGPMSELEDLLNCLRREYGDIASLPYPWHPDD